MIFKKSIRNIPVIATNYPFICQFKFIIIKLNQIGIPFFYGPFNSN